MSEALRAIGIRRVQKVFLDGFGKQIVDLQRSGHITHLFDENNIGSGWSKASIGMDLEFDWIRSRIYWFLWNDYFGSQINLQIMESRSSRLFIWFQWSRESMEIEKDMFLETGESPRTGLSDSFMFFKDFLGSMLGSMLGSSRELPFWWLLAELSVLLEWLGLLFGISGWISFRGVFGFIGLFGDDRSYGLYGIDRGRIWDLQRFLQISCEDYSRSDGDHSTDAGFCPLNSLIFEGKFGCDYLVIGIYDLDLWRIGAWLRINWVSDEASQRIDCGINSDFDILVSVETDLPRSSCAIFSLRCNAVILVYFENQRPDLQKSGKIFNYFDGRNYGSVRLRVSLWMDLGINGFGCMIYGFLWDGFYGSVFAISMAIRLTLIGSILAFTAFAGVESEPTKERLRFVVPASSISGVNSRKRNVQTLVSPRKRTVPKGGQIAGNETHPMNQGKEKDGPGGSQHDCSKNKTCMGFLGSLRKRHKPWLSCFFLFICFIWFWLQFQLQLGFSFGAML